MSCLLNNGECKACSSRCYCERWQGYKHAIADAKAKITEYASVWMSYNDGMSKEQIAEEALKSAKSAMIQILDSLCEENQ